MANSNQAEKSTTDAKDEARRAAASAGRHVRQAGAAVADGAELTYEELLEQVENLKADLAGLSAAARGVARKKAREAYAGANRARDRAIGAAEEGYELAHEQFNDALSQAETFARERPALALGLAAGGGFLLAKLMSRR